MKTKNPHIKKLILETILINPVELTARGEPVIRQSFKKEFVRGVREIKDTINPTVEDGYISIEDADKPFADQKIVWVRRGDAQTEENQEKVKGLSLKYERHKDEEIELSDLAMRAFKYYFAEADEMPDLNIDSLDCLEEILKAVN